MSHIEIAGLKRRIRAVRRGLHAGAEEVIDGHVADMQATAVQLVPKRTGTLARLLARDDAVAKEREGATLKWRFGFLSQEAKDSGWYWRFVEFGTRGYEPGEWRRAGTDRRGRIRLRRIKRSIPPRRAQPFLRPAFILFRQALRNSGLGGIVRAALRT